MRRYCSEYKGKNLKEVEFGKFVIASLRDGYVMTIYPEPKNGIFLDMKCRFKKDSISHQQP